MSRFEVYYVSKEVILRADRVERAGEVLRADGLVALRGGREAALAAAQDEGVAVALMPHAELPQHLGVARLPAFLPAEHVLPRGLLPQDLS